MHLAKTNTHYRKSLCCDGKMDEQPSTMKMDGNHQITQKNIAQFCQRIIHTQSETNEGNSVTISPLGYLVRVN